jgi:hypothetical protein
VFQFATDLRCGRFEKAQVIRLGFRNRRNAINKLKQMTAAGQDSLDALYPGVWRAPGIVEIFCDLILHCISSFLRDRERRISTASFLRSAVPPEISLYIMTEPPLCR